MRVALAAAAGGLTAWALTGVVRRLLLAWSVLDVPNERSSHAVPTPRGGGLAVAAVALGGIALGAASGWIPAPVAIALGGGGAAVAAVGWVDDYRGLSPSARITVHAAAATWAVAWLGGLPALSVGAGSIALGPAGAALALAAVLWGTNLYNFMDGIDGLAGAEGASVGLAGGGLLLAAGDFGLGYVALLIGAASAGFLVWNWAPARVFLGDVGSGLLGFLFAALAVASENAGSLPALVWLLLLGVFVVDATATLARRVVAGERWYAAHRTHAYQRLVRGGWSHPAVVAAALAANGGLALLAALAAADRRLLGPALAVAAGFLALLYVLVARRYPSPDAGGHPERLPG